VPSARLYPALCPSILYHWLNCFELGSQKHVVRQDHPTKVILQN
jgi:hypothetical protein